MIKFHGYSRLRPVRVVRWNNPDPVPVELFDGDILESVENLRDKETGRWGWAYTILRPVEEDETQ